MIPTVSHRDRAARRRRISAARGSALLLLAGSLLLGCGAREPSPGAYELQSYSNDGGTSELTQQGGFAVRLLLEESGGYILTVRDYMGGESRTAGTYMFGGRRLALCDSTRCRAAHLEYTYVRQILTLTLPEAEAERLGEPAFRWALKRR